MWFNQSITETLKSLNTSQEHGLTAQEVEKRNTEFGSNELEAKKPKTTLQIFLSQLIDWLIYVLFAAVLITTLMGEYVDSIIIILVILLNATIGTYQEVRAGKAIEALMKMSSPKAIVRREGHTSEVSSSELVPGNIVLLEAGRVIPADLRLIESAELQTGESALTGESLPAVKNAEARISDPKTPLGDCENMAFMSSVVTSGRGTGVVVETGMRTEVGKISHLIDSEEITKTPLEKRLSELGKMLGKMAVGICVFIFVLSLIQGGDLAEMFLTSVYLAAASIPEGLAAIVAVVLSLMVTTMSKKNAIIIKLPAVETLGSVNVICTDKTGTLTLNKMTVTQLCTLDTFLEFEKEIPTEISKDAKLLTKGMILCSDATLEGEESTGDPTEIALLALGDTLKINRNELEKKTKRLSEKPFDSERKMMSVLVEDEKGGVTVFTKGALGSLSKIATKIYKNGEVASITKEDLDAFSEAARLMSNEALRTLALAYRPATKETKPEEMEQELVLLGLVGMIDPARDEVKPSIQLAKEAGIRTLMITGDYKNTAFAIANDLEIAGDLEEVTTGPAASKFRI